MHKIYHEVIAAIGGVLFIIIGIARLRERRRLLKAGIKTEGVSLWNIFIIVGICLVVFAIGLMIYKLNRLPG